MRPDLLGDCCTTCPCGRRYCRDEDPSPGEADGICAECAGPHVCVVAHETSDGPDHGGAITVTGWCGCGRAVSVTNDSIL